MHHTIAIPQWLLIASGFVLLAAFLALLNYQTEIPSHVARANGMDLEIDQDAAAHADQLSEVFDRRPKSSNRRS